MTGALSAGSCDLRTKHRWEELPHVWGQGQQPGGPHAQRAAAKRSYPTSEVRGSSWEYQAVTVQERLRRATQVQGQGQRPRWATPRPKSGAAAGRTPCLRTPCPKGSGHEELPHVWGQRQRLRVSGCDRAGTVEKSYPLSEVRGVGQEELPYIRGQGLRPGGATPGPHAWGQGQSPGGPTPCPRSSGCAGAGGPRGAIPHWRSGRVAVRRCPLVQGKEQELRFAGAAVKRYHMPKVRETQVRW